jgi:hypothetical protein
MLALGADVSGWVSSRAMPSPSGRSQRDRTPRFLLPMAAGAIFSFVALGTIVAVRQLTRPPPPLLGTRSPELVADAARRNDGGELAEPGAGGKASGVRPKEGPGDGGSGLAASLPHGPEELRPPLRSGSSEAAVSRIDSLSGPATPPWPPGSAGSLVLSFAGPEVTALTVEQKTELTSCVRMISPRPPFQVVLQNINGVFYVDLNRTSPQLSGSQDFRDCLKLRVKGKIVPKVLTITRSGKGRTVP